MKICENCEVENDGSYGSGRFCCDKCARAFSTKEKRQEINQKVSKKLKGKPTSSNCGFKKGYDSRRCRRIFTDADRKKSVETWKRKMSAIPFNMLGKPGKRNRVLDEQNGKCLSCGLSEWMGEKLTLQIDHMDGNRKNNSRENLRGLCPNCHSITPTYCVGNSNHTGKKKVSDEELIYALQKNGGVIYKALEQVGLNGKCHYRSKKLLKQIS